VIGICYIWNRNDDEVRTVGIVVKRSSVAASAMDEMRMLFCSVQIIPTPNVWAGMVEACAIASACKWNGGERLRLRRLIWVALCAGEFVVATSSTASWLGKYINPTTGERVHSDRRIRTSFAAVQARSLATCGGLCRPQQQHYASREWNMP
jgi:hypothetical protein